MKPGENRKIEALMLLQLFMRARLHRQVTEKKTAKLVYGDCYLFEKLKLFRQRIKNRQRDRKFAPMCRKMNIVINSLKIVAPVTY